MGKKELYFDQAEDLYVVDCLTLEAIAVRLRPEGPSVNTLSKWKEDGDWSKRRREWTRDQQEIKKETLKLKRKLVARALAIMEGNNPGPQELYAASAIASRLGKTAAGERQEEIQTPDLDRPALFLEDLQFIANILKEVDPEGLKVFARNFDVIVARGKVEYAQTT